MIIVGVDYHPEVQQIASVDTDTRIVHTSSNGKYI
jgi:hypothetical protein